MAGSRTATLLFTDLVGSTALLTGLSRRAAEQVRQAHFALLRSAVESTGGTEVKNLGDGVMVVFPSAAAAVECAVGMQRAVERHNRRADVGLHLRIGVAMGEVVEDAGDFFGDAVVEAARLCAVADSDQILASGLMRATLGRHASHQMVFVGEQNLKGLPDPVEVWEVVWQRATDGPVAPLPARLSRSFPAEFVGRESEIEALFGAWNDVVGGERRVVLVAGEPGIGKTRLCQEFSAAVHADGAVVLHGGCDEGLDMPYRPWIEALEHLVAHLPQTIMGSFGERRLADVARVVPALRNHVGSLSPGEPADAEMERYWFFTSIAALLRATSDLAPLAVVLDDLHWADPPSLALLRHVIAAPECHSLMIVATYRDADVHGHGALADALASTRREHGVARIRLEGLGRDDLVDLVRGAAGDQLGGRTVELAAALHRDTDGNPFFAWEILRHLADTGYADAASGPDGGGVFRLPDSVREIVGRRVRRLGDSAYRVLGSAAVIGREVDVALLAAALDSVGDGELLEIIEQAIHAGLIVEVPGVGERFSFTHALIQQTLYEDVGELRRRRLHRRVAAILEERLGGDVGGRAAEVARHWVAAARPGDLDHAIAAAVRAGEHAVSTLAPDEGARWFETALRLLDDDDRPDEHLRCSLSIALADAQRQAGSPHGRTALLSAARMAQRLGDGGLLVRAALRRRPGWDSYTPVDTEELAIVEAALAAVGEEDSVDRARLLATLAGEELDSREWRRAREIAEEAIAVARRLGDDATLVAVLNAVYNTRCQPESLPQRLDETEEAIRLADGTGEPGSRIQARFWRIHASVEAGDLEEADRRVTEMEAITGERAATLLGWNVPLVRCWRSLLAGRLAEAEAFADGYFRVGQPSGHPLIRAAYGAQMMRIRACQGRSGEFLDEFIDLADNPSATHVRAGVIVAYCETGQFDPAHRMFAADAAGDFAVYPYNLEWLAAMVRCADAAVYLEDATAAKLLSTRLGPFAEHIAFPHSGVDGAVARALGKLAALLGRTDDADLHLRAALAIHQRLMSPYWVTASQLDRAEILIASGSRAEAERLLSHATPTAERFGFQGLQARAAPLAAACSDDRP